MRLAQFADTRLSLHLRQRELFGGEYVIPEEPVQADWDELNEELGHPASTEERRQLQTTWLMLLRLMSQPSPRG